MAPQQEQAGVARLLKVKQNDCYRCLPRKATYRDRLLDRGRSDRLAAAVASSSTTAISRPTCIPDRNVARWATSAPKTTTAEPPIASRIVVASPERPYLGIVLRLDPSLVSSVMVETALSAPQSRSSVKAVAVSPLDADLLDAMLRLVRLPDSPTDARFLAPLVTREIVYQHFKHVTGMSPLPFEKQLRLQEARRLLLSEHLDAASAGYRVGYRDASHCSRDYTRLFGVPSLRDAEQLRGGVAVQSAVL